MPMLLTRSFLSIFLWFHIQEQDHWPSLDMQPMDYGLGKTPHAPDPEGSPKWNHRDYPKK